MTKAQIEKFASTPEEKKIVADCYQAQERLGIKSKLFACTTEKEVKDFFAAKIAEKKALKERKAKKAAKEETKKAELDKVLAAYKKALANKISTDDVVAAIEKVINDKINAPILAQIEELKAKLAK